MKESIIYLTSVDPLRNRFRWYTVALQPTLFGGIDVVTWRGRIGQQGGVIKCYQADSTQTAHRIAERLLRLRCKHGYVLSNSIASWQCA